MGRKAVKIGTHRKSTWVGGGVAQPLQATFIQNRDYR
jgi:hypothetical protein